MPTRSSSPLNHGGPAVNPAVKEATARGAGFMAIHYGVEVNKGEQGENYPQMDRRLLRGVLVGQSLVGARVQGHSQARDHPRRQAVLDQRRMVLPHAFRGRHERRDADPVRRAAAQDASAGGKDKASSHGGNPDVYKEVADGKAQVMAWAYDRPDGGRGFGFTGLHKHDNLANDSMRTLLLNAVAWVSKLPVPEAGVSSKTLSRPELEALIDDGKLAVKQRGI